MSQPGVAVIMPGVIADLNAALGTLMETARGSQPADLYEAQTWEMAGAHACLVNGLLDIYKSVDQVPEEKYVDFVGYALQWTACVHHHHHWEEEFYYPLFSPKFDTSFIVAEHERFTHGLNDMEEYLVSCLPQGAQYGYDQVAPPHEQQPFNARRLLSIIDKFYKELVTHLVHEITYIHPDKLRASGLTVPEVKDIASRNEKYMKSMPGQTFLTYVVLLSPKETGFPPAPDFVKRFVVPWILSRAHRQWWQFAPKD